MASFVFQMVAATWQAQYNSNRPFILQLTWQGEDGAADTLKFMWDPRSSSSKVLVDDFAQTDLFVIGVKDVYQWLWDYLEKYASLGRVSFRVVTEDDEDWNAIARDDWERRQMTSAWNSHVNSRTEKFASNDAKRYSLNNIDFGNNHIPSDISHLNVYSQEDVDPARAVYILPNRRRNGSVDALYTFNNNGIGSVLKQANPTSAIHRNPFTFKNLRRVRPGKL